FLPPYEQSAILCGMRFLPPMVLHGAHRVSKEAVAEHLAVFSQRLQSYPDWPELEDLEQHPACVVPRKDRLVMGEDSIEAALTEDGDARAATRVGAPS
ncbi:MAG: NAD(P)H-dependent oxidoreductase, partial [Polaromonas sp.]